MNLDPSQVSNNTVDRSDEIRDPIGDSASYLASKIGDAASNVSSTFRRPSISAPSGMSDDAGYNSISHVPYRGLRQQRVEAASGMAEGGPVMGFDSQSPVIKGDNPVRAYEDGGDVGIPDDTSSENDTQNPDTGSSSGTGEASMGGGSQMGGDSAMGALQQAMTYGMQKYGLTEDSAGAVNTPEDGQNVQSYLSGADAYHPSDVAAAEKAVDPNGQMTPADRHMAVIEQSAPEDAHGVIQSDRKQHMGFAAGAMHALSQGDFSTAAQYAMEALNSIPSRFNIQVQWFPPASEKDQNSNPDLASAAVHGIPGIVSGLANSNAGKQLGQDLGAIGSAVKSVLPLQENAASFTQGTDQRNYEDMSPYVVQPRQLGTGDSSLPALETANATSKTMPSPTSQPNAKGDENNPQPNQGIPDIAGFNQAAAQNMASRGPMAGKAGEKQAMGGPGGAGKFVVTASPSGGKSKVEYLDPQQLAKVMGVDFNSHTSQGPANVIAAAAQPSTTHEGSGPASPSQIAQGYQPPGTTWQPQKDNPTTGPSSRDNTVRILDGRTGAVTGIKQSDLASGNYQNTFPMTQSQKFNQQLQLEKAKRSDAQDRMDARSAATIAANNARQTNTNQNTTEREAQNARARRVDSFLRNPALQQVTNPDGTTRQMNAQEKQAEAQRLGDEAYYTFKGQPVPHNNSNAPPGPIQINTAADYDKVQSGQQYKLPDGTVKTKK